MTPAQGLRCALAGPLSLLKAKDQDFALDGEDGADGQDGFQG
jgi:hypothetical protein